MLKPSDLLNPKIMDSLNKQLSKHRKKLFFYKEPKIEIIPTSYNVYIKSRFWRKRKNQYFDTYGRRCVVCGVNRNIQLHHKVYKNYGTENDNDLVALCRFHHNALHQATPLVYNMTKETDELIKEMKDYHKIIMREDNYSYPQYQLW